MGAERPRGIVDTNIVIFRDLLLPETLPAEMAISAVTLAELSMGLHAVVGDDVAARLERGRRAAILQRVENEFDPIPFDAVVARIYGQVAGMVIAHGRSPRRRFAVLQIAATAVASGVPLYTTNPDDFVGLESILDLVAVERPPAWISKE